MLKKLNQKLISNYPLLWNTRVIHVLVPTLIIHLLFYLSGFLNPIGLTDLWVHNNFSIVEVTMLSVLISVLTIIIWLAFYLRNNPLKRYYTLGKHYLFYEFLIILLIFFSTSTFFFTYQQGLYDHVKIESRDVDLKQEADLVNLAHHFIAFNKGAFDIRFCCDSIEARRIGDSVAMANNYTIYNSLYPPSNSGSGDNYYREQDTQVYERSYLYYCGQEVKLYSHYNLLSNYELNSIAARWLKGNHKDSVLKLLNQYKALCGKYGASLYFEPAEHIKEVFNDSRFTVRREIDSYHNDEFYVSRPYFYINHQNLNDALYKIEEVRHGFWNLNILFAMLYYTLGATILLFSFRITRLRHWFLGIIGIVLWIIIVSLIVIALRLDESTLIFVLFIWLVLLVATIINIVGKQGKLFAGIAFNWVLWFSPFVLPIIFALIYEFTKIDCYKLPSPCPPDPAIAVWINQNWHIINTINLVTMVAVMWLFFIPLAKKWQANPEE